MNPHIALFTQAHPETAKTYIGMAFAHPANESNLLVGVLVRAMMGRRDFGARDSDVPS